MHEQDEQTAPRFDVLHEVLARAARLGVTVTMNVHAVPVEIALEWVQEGLLDAIEKGAPGNPPTGRMNAGPQPGKTDLTVFIETPQEKERRIEREEDGAVQELVVALTEVQS